MTVSQTGSSAAGTLLRFGAGVVSAAGALDLSAAAGTSGLAPTAGMTDQTDFEVTADKITSSGYGTGLVLTYDVAAGVMSDVTATTPGTGYEVGEKVTVDSANIPGRTAGEDLVFTLVAGDLTLSTTVVITPTSGTFDTTNAVTVNSHVTTPIPTVVGESATTKWGDLGDWDVSGVKDFSYAFTAHRDKDGGRWITDGNLKVEAFVESHLWKAMSKFDTSSATTLFGLFNGAIQMNIDVSGWDVAKVRVVEWGWI